jgi:hypothetical protein
MRGGFSTDAGCPSCAGRRWRSGLLRARQPRGGPGQPRAQFGRYGETRAKLIPADKPLADIAGYTILPSGEVETSVLASVGARPWDRDPQDIRVLYYVAEGRGEVINDEKDVGGYPKAAEKRAPFVEADWDLASMTPRNGRYPGQKGGAQEKLSERDKAMRMGAQWRGKGLLPLAGRGVTPLATPYLYVAQLRPPSARHAVALKPAARQACARLPARNKDRRDCKGRNALTRRRHQN